MRPAGRLVAHELAVLARGAIPCPGMACAHAASVLACALAQPQLGRSHLKPLLRFCAALCGDCYAAGQPLPDVAELLEAALHCLAAPASRGELERDECLASEAFGAFGVT
jgi:hypothetical protein